MLSYFLFLLYWIGKWRNRHEENCTTYRHRRKIMRNPMHEKCIPLFHSENWQNLYIWTGGMKTRLKINIKILPNFDERKLKFPPSLKFLVFFPCAGSNSSLNIGFDLFRHVELLKKDPYTGLVKRGRNRKLLEEFPPRLHSREHRK